MKNPNVIMSNVIILTPPFKNTEKFIYKVICGRKKRKYYIFEISI